MADQEMLKEQLKPIISLLDQYPTGVRIPSEWSAPDGYKLEKMEVCGAPVEHLYPKEGRNHKVILQFHGGGFLFALLDCYRDAAYIYSQKAGGADVYSVDYRVSPENRFPCADEDGLNTYKWLLENGISNEDIIIIGDSAGGNLALSVTMQIRDKNIPLPKAIIAISPWGCLDSNFGSKFQNRERDLILGKYGMKIGTGVINATYYAEEENYRNPYVSPIFGRFEGFPDMLVQSGDYDMLLGDSKEVVKRSREAGVNCGFTVYKEMSHDFQLLLGGIEESQKAWAEIQEFLIDKFELR